MGHNECPEVSVMNQKRYSESFKKEAVKLVKEKERSIPQVAKELGISISGLRKWIEAEEVENGQRDGLTVKEKDEIRELKRKIQVLRMEREILKKATAFFAKCLSARPHPSVIQEMS
jgi:transposase